MKLILTYKSFFLNLRGTCDNNNGCFWWEQVAIPVVPTVRVVITFTKFVELQPIEEFFTPFSSPRQFVNGRGSEEETEGNYKSWSSSSWLSRSSSRSCSTSKQQTSQQDQANPFAIPSEYTWSSFDEKSRKMKKSKSTRKTK